MTKSVVISQQANYGHLRIPLIHFRPLPTADLPYSENSQNDTGHRQKWGSTKAWKAT